MKFSGFNTTEKVGIGTNAPKAELQIGYCINAPSTYGAATDNTSLIIGGPNVSLGVATLVMVGQGSGNGQTNNEILFGAGNSKSARIINFQDGAGDAIGGLKFNVFNGATETNAVTILNDGKVGIGTTAPSAILHIRSSGTARNVFYVAASDNSHLAGIYEESDGRGALNVRNAGGTATINLDSGGDSYFTGGNFGIGTTSLYAGTNVTSLTINATSYPTLSLNIGGTVSHVIMGYSLNLNIDAIGNRSINLRTNDTDRLSISGAGAATFSGSLKAVTILDTNNSAGTNGQVLTTTGSALDWKTLSEISGVDGSGTANYISKWTDGDTIGNSSIHEGAAGSLQIEGPSAGRFLTLNAPTTGGYITFETADTAFADIGTPKAISGIATYSTTDLMINARSGAKNIVFGMNGYEKVRIDSNGKVGIGTTAPAVLLDIYEPSSGSAWIKLGNSSRPAGMYIGMDAGELQQIYVGGNNPFTFWTNDTEKVRITGDGKVGIGTASPNSRLEIAGFDSTTTLGDSIDLLIEGGGNVNKLAQLGLGWTGHSSGVKPPVVLAAKTIVASGHTYADFIIANRESTAGGTAPVEHMRVTYDGNVGIGTTSPVHALHVYDTTGNASAVLIDGSASNSGFLSFRQAGVEKSYIQYTSNSYLRYFAAGGHNFAQNVGINKTVPDSWLHIEDDYSLTKHLLHVKGGGASGAYGVLVETANGTDLFKIDTLSYKVSMPSGYPVGIGTPDPAALLHIQHATAPNIRIERTTGATSGSLGLIEFGARSVDDNLVTIYAEQDGATDAGKLTFSTEATGGALTERMTIKSDGKVGIGTTAPDRMLHLYGGASGQATPTASSLLVLEDDGSSNYISFLNPNAGNAGIIWGDPQDSARAQLIYDHNTGYMTFNPGGAERVFFKSDGKVGINSTNPSTILSLGGSLATGGIYINSGADEDHTIIDMTGITGGGKLIWDDGEEAFSMSKGLRVTAGNVGIGTTAPSGAILDIVAGDNSTPQIKLRAIGANTQAKIHASGSSGNFELFTGDGDGNQTIKLSIARTSGAATFSGTVNAAYVISTGYAQASSLRIPSTTNYHEIWSSGDELRIYRNQSAAIRIGASNLVTLGGALTVGANTTLSTNGSGHTLFGNNTANKDMNYTVTGTGGHYFSGSLVRILANVGIGGSPPTFYTGIQAVTLGTGGVISGVTTGNPNLTFTDNSYINAAGNNVHRTGTNPTTKLEQYNGTLLFQNAVAAAAGATAAYVTRFSISAAGTVTTAGLQLGGGVISHGSSNASSIVLCGGNSSSTTGANITLGGNSGSADRAVIFKANSTETLRIASDGNVGIGTTAAGKKLEVRGEVRIADAGIPKLWFYDTSTAQLASIRHSSGTTRLGIFDDSNNERFTVITEGGASQGRVGIGTATPAGLLTVRRNDAATGGQLVIEQDSTGDATLRWLLTSTQSWMAGIDNSDVDKFKISSDGTGVETATKLTIQVDGKVGIGTDAPSKKLHVHSGASGVGASGDVNMILEGASNVGLAMLAPNNQGSRIEFGSVADNNEGIIYYNNAGSYFSIYTNGTRQVDITSDGNFGIGTATPGNVLPTDFDSDGLILEVVKNAKDAGITLGYKGTTVLADIWTNASTSNLNIDNRYNSANAAYGCIDFRTRTKGTMVNAVRIQPDGNVGIGTTAPAQKLHVNGNILVNAQILTPGGSNLALNPNTGLVTVGGALQASGTSLSTFGGPLTVSGNITTNGSQFYFYRAVNSGNPEFHIGSAAAERLTIQSVYASGAQTLASVSFRTFSSLGAANAGQMNFYVDNSSTEILKIQDTGITTLALTGTTAAFTATGAADVDILTLDNNRNTVSDQWGIKFQDSFRTRARIHALNENAGNARGSLVFETGYSTDTVERVRINSDGKVGIGTDTCASILHVDAEMSLGQDGNNRSMLGYSNSTNRLYIGTRQSSTNYFDTVSVTSGKVGIGTTSPSEKLQVVGNLYVQAPAAAGNDVSISIMQQGSNVNTDDCRIKFMQSDGWQIEAMNHNANGNSAYDFGINYNRNAHAGDFYIANNGTKRLKLDSSGHLLPGANGTYNLGGSGNYWANCYFESTAINGTLYVGGVLTAASNVDVAQSKYLRVGGSTSTAPFSARQVSGSSMVHLMELNTGSSVQAYSFGLDTVGNYIDFVIQSEYGAGSWGERFRITKQYGCVGIGTNAPDSKLHVYGGKIHVKVTSGTGSGAHIQGYSDASTPKLLTLGTHSYGDGTLGMTTISGHGYLETYGAFDLHLRPNQSTGMVIKNGGKVGIGTTAPVDKLHLASGGKFRNGHGVEYSSSTYITNNTTTNYTIAAMAYGTAEFHVGLYGNGAAINVHVTLGGHMSSSSKIYCATVLANETLGNATVTLSENNGNYVVGIGNTSGFSIYGSFWFKSSTYTDGAGVATLTVS